MRKRRSSSALSNGARGANGKATLGRERFAKISAVEGIELTALMRQRIAEFDRRGLSAAERRRSIVRFYRNG